MEVYYMVIKKTVKSKKTILLKKSVKLTAKPKKVLAIKKPVEVVAKVKIIKRKASPKTLENVTFKQTVSKLQIAPHKKIQTAGGWKQNYLDGLKETKKFH